MRRLLIAITGLLLLSWSGLCAGAQARTFTITAQVDTTTVAPGEAVLLTVTLRGGNAEPDLSAVTDFKVYARGSGTSVQIINGQVSREVKYNYQLVPLNKGRLNIPPIRVVFKGKSYASQPISIQVQEASQTGSSQRDLMVEAVIDNPQPFEGQQCFYTFRLYQAVQLTNARLQKPEFQGFDAREAGESRAYRKILSGREYTVAEIRYVLLPLKAGDFTIEPAVLRGDRVVQRNTQRRQSRFDQFFNDSFFGRAQLKPVVLQTEPLQVNVRQLPALQGPEAFSGLVGNFNIIADLEQSTIKAGDSTTLAISIEGHGDIMDLKRPALKLPAAFKVYEDTPEEQIDVGPKGYRGKKVFRLALVGLEPGDYTLPPATVIYFDPVRGAYHSATTKALDLRVTPSEEAPPSQGNLEPPPGSLPELKPRKRQVQLANRDILPLKEDPDALASQSAPSLARFLLWLILPGIGYSAGLLWTVLSQKNESPQALINRRMRRALKEAESPGLDDEAFLASLSRAVTAAILTKSGAPGESLTYGEARRVLLQHNVPEQTADVAARLLETLDSARFGGGYGKTPLDSDDRQELLQQVQELIKLVA